MNTLLPLLGIYFFILLGYVAKKILKEELDERSIVLISMYFLQPIMAIWGLSLKPLNLNDINAPLFYLIISLLILSITAYVSKKLFKDQKDISIASIASIIGNTGNLGIPLGIVLIGEESVLYTSLINLSNVFIVYTFGVYYYSRGVFSIKESLLNIIKLPVIWFSLFAIALNINAISLPSVLNQPLLMGAYATMVIQLMIFGMYLSRVSKTVIDYKLLGYISSIKFVFIPALGLSILHYFPQSPIITQSILLSLIMPLAVMNVNLSALYRCNPKSVTFLTFATSLFFLLYLFFVAPYLF